MYKTRALIGLVWIRSSKHENHKVVVYYLVKQSKNIFLRDRLCASDMIQIKKVIEHVYEKFFGSESSGTNSTPGNEREPSTVESEDISQIAHSKIELYCNDQVGCRSHLGIVIICESHGAG